jgi:molybdopterin converting factor small subunit
MTIRLRVFGALETYLGGARLAVKLPAGASLRNLLDLIDAQWGDKLPPQFWNAETKRFRGPVLIMSQGIDMYDEDTPLSDQQEIMLLVPLAGG